MKKTVAALLCFFLLQETHAQITDSAVNTYRNLICNCVDTLNLDRSDAALRNDFNACKTSSLANLLQTGLITPEIKADEKQYGELEKQTFNLLAKCDGIKRLLAALKKAPAYREKNADNIFIPVAFFKTYGLQPGEVNNLLHVYNSEKTGDTKYQRLVDIRWTFETEAEALQWHQKKMLENAENGEPVKELITVQGAQELKIFRESSSSSEMLKSFGLKQRHHYFLFVYKNIVCKIFVATDDKTETRELVPFAMAAVKQLKAFIQ